jgi:hypothetical protein
VKKTGRDEPIWVVVHICMETTQGISLYSCLYLKLAKMPCFSFYFLCFSSTKSENRRVEHGQPWGGGWHCGEGGGGEKG